MPHLAASDEFTPKSLLGVGVAIIVAAGLAGVLSRLEWWSLSQDQNSPFTFLSFLGSLFTLGLVFRFLKKRGHIPVGELVPHLAFFAVAIHILFLFHSDYVELPWDYSCYQRAARAILSGVDPYLDRDLLYLYPPFLATVLAGAHEILVRIGLEPQVDAWFAVFFFYQTLQIIAICLGFALCYRFSRVLGASTLVATLLTSILFFLNNPLDRTIAYGQINVFVLDCILIALLYFRERPWISGAVLALGTHLKIWPVLVIGAFGLRKKWHVFGSAMVFSAAIAFMQLIHPDGLQMWIGFWNMVLDFPDKTDLLRNTSFDAIYRSIAVFGGIPGEAAAVGIMGGLTRLAILSWFSHRLIRAQVMWRTLPRSRDDLSSLRLPFHVVDALALGLLISPSIWEHHFVLVMPLVVFAVCVVGPIHPWKVGLGTSLMMFLPTIDVFLLSSHRLIGLILLVLATSPTHVLASCTRSEAEAGREENGRGEKADEDAGVIPSR